MTRLWTAATGRVRVWVRYGPDVGFKIDLTVEDAVEMRSLLPEASSPPAALEKRP